MGRCSKLGSEAGSAFGAGNLHKQCPSWDELDMMLWHNQHCAVEKCDVLEWKVEEPKPLHTVEFQKLSKYPSQHPCTSKTKKNRVVAAKGRTSTWLVVKIPLSRTSEGSKTNVRKTSTNSCTLSENSQHRRAYRIEVSCQKTHSTTLTLS